MLLLLPVFSNKWLILCANEAESSCLRWPRFNLTQLHLYTVWLCSGFLPKQWVLKWWHLNVMYHIEEDWKQRYGSWYREAKWWFVTWAVIACQLNTIKKTLKKKYCDHQWPMDTLTFSILKPSSVSWGQTSPLEITLVMELLRTLPKWHISLSLVTPPAVYSADNVPCIDYAYTDIHTDSQNNNVIRSECVSRVLRPARHITGHFRVEPFQAITCTGTDNTKQTGENTQKKHNKQALGK